MSMTATSQKGIGLVETLLAMGIAVIIVTAMVGLAIFTLRSSLQNKLALEGSQIANQEIEQVRAYRDSMDWNTFVASVDGTDGTDCFTADCYMSGAPVAGVLTTDGGTPQEINQSFRITDQSGGDKTLLRISVTVSWRIGSEFKYAHTYTELSNWMNVQ